MSNNQARSAAWEVAREGGVSNPLYQRIIEAYEAANAPANERDRTGSWEIVVNPALTDDQAEFLRQTVVAAQEKGLVMVSNFRTDKYIIVGHDEEESKAEALTIERALNSAAGGKAPVTLQPVELSHVALGFAKCAHRKQKRKYTGEHYAVHCEAVARIVAEYTDDQEVIAAACLHDTLEDTDVTDLELDDIFGHRVATLVAEVTDVSRREDGNRQARKSLDREHLAKSSPEGATIKLADLIDNTGSIVKYDKGFARSYLREKEALLEVLKHGNADLWQRAYATLQDAQRELVQHSLSEAI